ncbi:MAG: DAK2 domain-containing protein [Defluviitaleaceae bacterium]|nr:DAK2 domain-containing protein [Defluviitaleaceae bacterium]
METHLKITQIDAQAFKNALIAAANALVEKRDTINSLNVFPVPDGDTGTNMSLTLMAAAKEARSVISQNVSDVAKAASSGALRGARGNSGVILSQLFRGFSRGLSSAAAVATIAAEDLSRAFAGSTQAAYSAVMKPREGTILTISRAISERAASFRKSDNPDRDDVVKLLDAVLEHGRKVLPQTTNMLPELKAAGVVDAGGEGLLTIWEAVRESLFKSGEIELIEEMGASTAAAASTHIREVDIQFTYCTEFFINVDPARVKPNLETSMMSYLEKHGDSIVVVRDEGLVKVHTHTNHPGNVLEYALTLGSLSSVKIDNMREQNHEMASFIPQPSGNTLSSNTLASQAVVPLTGDIGFIAVSSGGGFAEIFTKLGVTHIIEGGQTMNPSTDDILKAAESIPAPDIFVLPNNKNIILAARQAAEMINGKTLHVLNTKSVPQGIAAMVSFVPGVSAADNFSQMTDAAKSVTTGQVTYAVRDTELDGRTISEGDILGLVENEIVASSKTVADCAAQVLAMLAVDEPGLISIYAGADVLETDSGALLQDFQTNFPDIEIEFHNGGQPLYYYVFSAE